MQYTGDCDAEDEIDCICPTFKQAVYCLHCDYATVVNFIPWFLNQGHTNRQGVQACEECNQFRSTVMRLFILPMTMIVEALGCMGLYIR